LSLTGTGIDIVEVDRIGHLLARHGRRFLERCFRPGETTSDPESLAARWAAKEAFLKALGGYVGNIPYRDIEVVRSGEGPVSLKLHGRALTALERTGTTRIHLAVSHERGHAVASVILEE